MDSLRNCINHSAAQPWKRRQPRIVYSAVLNLMKESPHFCRQGVAKYNAVTYNKVFMNCFAGTLRVRSTPLKLSNNVSLTAVACPLAQFVPSQTCHRHVSAAFNLYRKGTKKPARFLRTEGIKEAKRGTRPCPFCGNNATPRQITYE